MRKNVSKRAPNRKYWVAVRYYGNKRRLQTLPDPMAAAEVRRRLGVQYTRAQLDAGLEMYAARRDADIAVLRS